MKILAAAHRESRKASGVSIIFRACTLYLKEEKADCDIVADHCKVDKEVPHEVVVAEPFLGVEVGANGVEDAASQDQEH